MKKLESEESSTAVFLLTTGAAFSTDEFERYSPVVKAHESGVCLV